MKIFPEANLKRATLPVLILLPLIMLCSCAHKMGGTDGPQTFQHAAVVTAYPDASKVGADILKKGGNAVDAAVAVSFALAVTLPSAGNIGGGGFMVLRMANGEANTLDFREKAPASASRNMYLDSSGNVTAGASLIGTKAAGVPVTVDGMYSAHEKYGKLPWKQLIQPAIDLARNGFRITKQTADGLNGNREDFMKINPQSTYLINNDKWKEGDILKQEDLAKTLEIIRDNGRDGFYAGSTAQKIVAEMQQSNGIITLNDLSNYKSIWRKPITGFYQGNDSYERYDIITMPPPSSGGVALMQLLKMMEPYAIARTGFHSSASVHLMTEAENRVYADRAEWMGDPDYFHVPIGQLLDSSYNRNRMKDFDSVHATPASAIKAGDVTVEEREQTTHYSIIDQWGNAVAVTTTLNGSCGCKVFVEGAGFLLNNEMDDFSIKPGVPNAYGLVGGEANAIEPGKRMLSSMTPTIVTKNGKLFMVVGSPGGSTIITTVFQTIVNVVDFNMNMQQAVDAKRFHSQWLPDEIQTEINALDTNVINQLRAMGHKVKERGPIGHCDAILVLPNGGYETGADNRGDNTPAGW